MWRSVSLLLFDIISALSFSPPTRLFIFFFFLNDTAPPEISTLPLHAALPISDLKFDVTDPTPTISGGALTQAQAEQGGAALLTWLPAGEFQITAVPGSAEGKVVIDQALWRDRKSTRLNSSHSQISYAVFCLKK